MGSSLRDEMYVRNLPFNLHHVTYTPLTLALHPDEISGISGLTS